MINEKYSIDESDCEKRENRDGRLEEAHVLWKLETTADINKSVLKSLRLTPFLQFH